MTANITYHEMELQHSYLTKRQRQDIAAKSALGVHPDMILEDVRETICLNLSKKSYIGNIR